MQNSRDHLLDSRLAEKLANRKKRSQLRALTLTDEDVVDFSSNAYLSLSTDEEVNRAYLDRLHRRWVDRRPLLGSGGSRLLDGNSKSAESLEGKIAQFHGALAGLLFNSAMDANVGLLGSVPQPGDVVVYDEYIHASAHDGMRTSRASKTIAFSHNSVASLEEILRSIQQTERKGPDPQTSGHIFIVVEGIYSMDGDAAPLAQIVECIERHLPPGHGHLIVDEAHSVGLFGPQGRGLVCALGLCDRVWARVLGFGKALGCSGGVVLCSSTTRMYLVNYARTLIYTTAMSYSTLAAIETVYDFLSRTENEEKVDARIARVHELARYAHSVLSKTVRLSSPKPGTPNLLIRVQQNPPVSPILPLITTDPRGLARHCQSRGFMVRPIVAPTVAPGEERVRVCLHACNSVEQIDGLARAVKEWLLLGSSRGPAFRL